MLSIKYGFLGSLNERVKGSFDYLELIGKTLITSHDNP